MRTRERVADEMLVLAAQARQVEAFERLAIRWHPRLLRYAHRLTGDSEGAREVAQEAWVAIARGLGRLEDPATFGPWALRITNRRCADWIARRQKTRRRTAVLDAAAEATTEHDSRGNDLARVRDALRRLDPDRRALMAMFYVEGLTVAEIASVLEIPAGTVKSRLYYARARLRAALEVCDERED
jgi:RNA polymerase sigma-70 factor (ECF subfamily)